MSGNMSMILGLSPFGKIGTSLPGQQHRLIGGGANSNSGTGMVGGGERGLNRKLLRQSFGNNTLGGSFNRSPLYYANQAQKGAASSGGQGPFRAAFNAGDSQGTVNEGPHFSLPRPNQVNNITPVSLKYDVAAGGIRTGKAAYTGNPKYVHDSSDFARFKKLKAIGNNYNDSSFGGSNNGAFSAIMRVRH